MTIYTYTYTGRKFDVANPDLASISIIDIAHALSNTGRYGGHADTFYSAAQHCCLLASYAEQKLRASVIDCLQVLMHDAAEAYLGDVQRPIKQHLSEFHAMEREVEAAIRGWLGMRKTILPPFQDEIDKQITVDERLSLMTGHDWSKLDKSLGLKILPWTPKWAEKQFLMRYAAYSFVVYGAHQYVCDDWDVAPRLQATISSEHPSIEDVIEVDLRGGVGRVKLKTSDGMLERNPNAAPIPEPKWKWVHGQFALYLGRP